MIGLGSQYLTAAGFGRYRITAASLGNLDLLPWLKWLTQATIQAIVGAFGQRDGMVVIKATNAYLNQLAASGQAGKDKATALAGFINEDPMLVCSLPMSEYLPSGFVMPKRYLVGDGTAYINTEIAPSANTLVSMDYCPMNDAEYYIFGARSSNSSLVIFVLNRYQGKIRSTNNNTWASTNYSINVNTDYNIGRVNNDVYGNGTIVYSGPQTLGTLPSDAMYIFTAQVYGAPSQHNGIFGLDKVKIGNAAHMITCKHNGQNGMYDIERKRWFGNANSSGSFTISETPSTP